MFNNVGSLRSFIAEHVTIFQAISQVVTILILPVIYNWDKYNVLYRIISAIILVLIVASVLFILLMATIQMYRNREINKTKDCVHEFYINVCDDINISWDKISNDYKRCRWSNDFNKFKNGYLYTKGIKILTTSLIGIKQSEYTYFIAYIDTSTAPIFSGLKEVQNLNYLEIDKFYGYFNNLNEKLCEYKINDNPEISSLLLKYCFKANFTERIRYYLNANQPVVSVDGIRYEDTEQYSFIEYKIIVVKFEKSFFNIWRWHPSIKKICQAEEYYSVNS